MAEDASDAGADHNDTKGSDDLLAAMIAGLSPDQRRTLIARIEASLA